MDSKAIDLLSNLIIDAINGKKAHSATADWQIYSMHMDQGTEWKKSSSVEKLLKIFPSQVFGHVL